MNEYDRAKPFIMTSPLFGMAHGNYLFIDGGTGKESFALFRDSKYTCYTEFGIPFVGDKEAIKKVIPNDLMKFLYLMNFFIAILLKDYFFFSIKAFKFGITYKHCFVTVFRKANFGILFFA